MLCWGGDDMARYVWPTAEEQIQTHLGGPIVTEALNEELRRSLPPVGIMRKGGETYYSCCRRYHTSMGYHHREYGQCPMCGRVAYHIRQCHIKADERQEQFHFLYRRSMADENTILIIGIWAAQIWQDAKWCDPEDVEMRIQPHSLIVIPWGGKPVRYVNEWSSWGRNREMRWVRRDRVQGGTVTSWKGGGIEQVNHGGEFKAVIRGTRFEKMLRWVQEAGNIYYTCDYAEVLAEIAKYPQMEYMAARGLGGLVRDKMNHAAGAGLVNWRSKRIGNMLPLTRDELGRIKAKGYAIQSRDLMPIKYAREYGQLIKLEDAMAVMEAVGRWEWHTAGMAVKAWGRRWGVMRILRYLARVEGKHHGDARMWLDYMEELRQLGGLEDEAAVFPRNLREAHAQTSTRLKIKASEEQQKTLAERLPELQKRYTFEAGNIRMEPFASLEEVIAEGQIQSICIGSYAKSYAEGKTILCKMRRRDAPGEPWHAVEFTTAGRMVQCRGDHNATYADEEKEVRAFWAAWDQAHQTKTNVNIHIKQRRQSA